jgi:hypothetical protein
LAGELDEVAAAAFRARATIYALESRNLVGPNVELTAPDWALWDAHRVMAQDGLRKLAERTGGQLVWTWSDLDSALEQIALARK